MDQQRALAILFLDRRRRHGKTADHFFIVGLENRREARLQLGSRGARIETPKNAEPSPGHVGEGGAAEHHGGHPDVDELAGLDAKKSLARDADDLGAAGRDHGVYCNPYALADDVRIATEAAPPVVVADDDIRMAPGDAILGGREDASHRGRDLEDIEGIAGYELANRFFHGRVLIGNANVALGAGAEQAEARRISGGGAELLEQRIAKGDVFDRAAPVLAAVSEGSRA